MSAEGETCVFPDIHSSSMPNIPWRKENKESEWYSKLRGGSKVMSQKRRIHSVLPQRIYSLNPIPFKIQSVMFYMMVSCIFTAHTSKIISIIMTNFRVYRK